MKEAYKIIKELRIKNGLSQKALAEKIGTSQQAIALLENGKRKIDFDLFIKTLEVLNEPISNIFGEELFDDKDFDAKFVFKTINDQQAAFIDIIKACGGVLYSSDDNNILKYDGHSVNLSNTEYFNLMDNIFNYVKFLLCQLSQQDMD